MTDRLPSAADPTGIDIASFPTVDAADAHALIGYLDAARALPGLRIAKAEAMARLELRPGQVVVDVGCGPGEDALEMARRVIPGGQVIGVDSSLAMLAEARRRAAQRGLTVDFREGSAHRLPLPDRSADRCRADTLLQHVPDPDLVVAEMVRVVRPGGRVSGLEFDLGTFVLDHPDRDTTAQIAGAMAAAAGDGWAGRGLRRRFADAGLVDVSVRQLFVEPDHRFISLMVEPVVRRLTATGAVSGPVLDRWQADLATAWANGSYTAGAVVFVAHGRVPRPGLD